MNTEIRINLVDAASKLAHNAARDEMFAEGTICEESDMNEDNSQEMTTYTEEAQEIYSRWYDYFYNEISGCEIKDDAPTKFINDQMNKNETEFQVNLERARLEGSIGMPFNKQE